MMDFSNYVTKFNHKGGSIKKMGGVAVDLGGSAGSVNGVGRSGLAAIDSDGISDGTISLE